MQTLCIDKDQNLSVIDSLVYTFIYFIYVIYNKNIKEGFIYKTENQTGYLLCFVFISVKTNSSCFVLRCLNCFHRITYEENFVLFFKRLYSKQVGRSYTLLRGVKTKTVIQLSVHHFFTAHYRLL